MPPVCLAHWRQLVYSQSEAAHQFAVLQAIKDEILGTGESDDEDNDGEEGSEDESGSEEEQQEQQKMQIQVWQFSVCSCTFVLPFILCGCGEQHRCHASDAYSLQSVACSACWA